MGSRLIWTETGSSSQEYQWSPIHHMSSYLNVQTKLINCKLTYLRPFYVGKHTFMVQESGAGFRILRIPGVLQQPWQRGRATPAPGRFPFAACSTGHSKVTCLYTCGNHKSNIQLHPSSTRPSFPPIGPRSVHIKPRDKAHGGSGRRHRAVCAGDSGVHSTQSTP